MVLNEEGKGAVRATDELVRRTERRAKASVKVAEPALRWRAIELKVRALRAVSASRLASKVVFLQDREQCGEVLGAQLQGLAPAIVRLVVQDLEERLRG